MLTKQSTPKRKRGALAVLPLCLFSHLLGSQSVLRSARADQHAPAATFLREVQEQADLIMRGPRGAEPWRVYSTGLRGTTVDRWAGWITKITAISSMRSTLAVSPTEPRALASAAPLQDGPRVLLTGVAMPKSAPITVGQHVRFSGTIQQVYIDSGVVIELAHPAVEDISSASPAPGGPQGVRISLERTACLGRCPIYQVSVDGAGTVQWQGMGNVRARGSRTARISPQKVQKLLRDIDQAGFFSLPDAYPMRATDHPSIIVSVTRGGQTKQIQHNLSNTDVPEALSRLEADIDNHLRTAAWVGR